MATSYQDLFTEQLSDCCGAPMYSDIDMCSDCKEHCTSTIEMEELESEIAGVDFSKELSTLKNLSAVKLGSIKTEKKANSSRENGKKGGRPRKDDSKRTTNN